MNLLTTLFSSAKDRWIVAGLIVGVWTLVILGSSGHDFLYDRMQGGGSKSFLTAAHWPGIYWYTWALLTPVVFQFASRFRLTGRRRWRNLAVLIVACGVMYALHVAIQLAAMMLPHYADLHASWSEAIYFHVFSSIEANVVTFWLIVGAWYAGDYYRTSRAQELRNANLESQLVRAELQALKMQIHPHFLFNTLHGIAETMYRDVPAADRMLADLSDLLRTSVDRTHDAFVSLGDEITFVEKYLGIEQARFRDRLTVEVSVDEAARDAFVPSFVLQPFVENALKHGVAAHSRAAHVSVRASVENGRLQLTVRDTVLRPASSVAKGAMPSPDASVAHGAKALPDAAERVGAAPARAAGAGSSSDKSASTGSSHRAVRKENARRSSTSSGVGIENVAGRLDRLFGDDYDLRLSPHDSGFTVELRLPLKTAALPV